MGPKPRWVLVNLQNAKDGVPIGIRVVFSGSFKQCLQRMPACVIYEFLCHAVLLCECVGGAEAPGGLRNDALDVAGIADAAAHDRAAFQRVDQADAEAVDLSDGVDVGVRLVKDDYAHADR